MTRNVGTLDRVLRGLVALGLVVAAFTAPFALELRIVGFGLSAAYMAFSALAGTCLGYRLMGKSSCAIGQR